MQIEVRTACCDDASAIRRVHEEAFGGRANEANLVEALTVADNAPISLVAVLNNQVVGHALFSEVTMEPASAGMRAVGLAPVAVLPDHQRRGIGSRLIREGLAACREAGYAAAVVLGDPGYYSRFGFARASSYGLTNEYGADEEFMVMELVEDAMSGRPRLVKYATEFTQTGC